MRILRVVEIRLWIGGVRPGLPDRDEGLEDAEVSALNPAVGAGAVGQDVALAAVWAGRDLVIATWGRRRLGLRIRPLAFARLPDGGGLRQQALDAWIVGP